MPRLLFSRTEFVCWQLSTLLIPGLATCTAPFLDRAGSCRPDYHYRAHAMRLCWSCGVTAPGKMPLGRFITMGKPAPDGSAGMGPEVLGRATADVRLLKKGPAKTSMTGGGAPEPGTRGTLAGWEGAIDGGALGARACCWEETMAARLASWAKAAALLAS